VPALPSSILEPLWVQVAALLPARQDTHPLGCHRPRIPDRIVFDKLIQRRLVGRAVAAGAPVTVISSHPLGDAGGLQGMLAVGADLLAAQPRGGEDLAGVADAGRVKGGPDPVHDR
jgi:hypothetical protein